MKLAVVVFASILAVCSVTIASPVIPSSTTSAYPSTSTFTDLDVDSVYCEGFSSKPKKLIKKYATVKRGADTAEKDFRSASMAVDSQKELVKHLSKKVKLLKAKRLSKNDDSSYSETVIELRKMRRDLVDLEKQREICDDEYSVWRRKFTYMRRLQANYMIMDCIHQFYTGIPNRLSESMYASISGMQGPSQQDFENSPPSYDVVMNNPKHYKVTLQGTDPELPSYDKIMQNLENFPKVLEDPDVTQPSLVETSAVHPTQTSSSVPPSQHTASSTLQRVSSTLRRAKSFLSRH
ncbi:hypothetical protein BATDEDRAFT_21134 [Batrachochytrium dendrobatidis JAM81]|uniref:Uncharacterized protein n=1 Tax=Batrachochytrium dendrobatidis (strain JAM81 / FGSC 10211) TaxID=684364 RepID=F4NRA2_BATDJ|nr:uncharacterized protein BATDEDRAFT_21134 [Batrachochytrium dendrobatidis JAM81]EGF82914.1 hypothetical protein BATDEDRAFT_21134 [Batrachochytrium dendrobatidis JAM81]|eukprot:XP_006675207.1 hypothetical protein BATDEDRAFT_21134 [Batrachochytrium dendrobatidis JAM81]